MRQPRRAWTRTAKRVANKAYVKGVPDSRIHMFEMGSASKQKEFDTVINLVSSEHVQVRDGALEAARVSANKLFEKVILPENYFFKVKVYPHQCLREHSMLTGAGADRLSDGMRLSFGRPSGRAAVVKKGQSIMTVYTFKRFKDAAMQGLERARRKVPGNSYVEEKKKK
jgi:large subunit ribosomal protein L10e